ncbi:MAG: 7TM-DISM domain-containing protein [Bacteroidota bacterium]
MLHLFKRCLLLPVMLVVSAAMAQPVAQNGVLDARLFDFSGHRLALNGVWAWYDNELVAPAQTTEKPAWVAFPQTWNDARLSRSGQGVATYSLLVLLPAEAQRFGIELPQIYSSYRLWANGKLIAENGVPGISEVFTVPQWMPQTVYCEARDSMRLTLQIANFHHHKGGCKDPIFLGSESTMRTKESIAMTSKLAECGLLILLALMFLAIYWAHGRKKVVIYFSLLCATWAVRSLFSNDYTFISLVPDFDWNTMVRIEYITLYLTMIWAILFLGRLFANDGSQIVKYVLVTLNGIFIAFTVLNPPVYFTKMLAVYLFTSGLLLLYGAIIVVRALINERAGATFLTLSTLLAIAIFSYDIFTYEGWFSYNSIVFSAGYLVIFVLMAIALLIHLNIISAGGKGSNMLTYEDLYGESAAGRK